MEKQMGVRVFLLSTGNRIAAVTNEASPTTNGTSRMRAGEAKHDGKAIAGLERSYLQAAGRGYRVSAGDVAKAVWAGYFLSAADAHWGFDARMLPRSAAAVPVARVHVCDAGGGGGRIRSTNTIVDPKLLSGPDTLEGAMARSSWRCRGGRIMGRKLEAVCK